MDSVFLMDFLALGSLRADFLGLGSSGDPRGLTLERLDAVLARIVELVASESVISSTDTYGRE